MNPEKKYKKLVDVDTMKVVLNESAAQESPRIKNLLKIDTGKNTIDESVDMIRQFAQV